MGALSALLQANSWGEDTSMIEAIFIIVGSSYWDYPICWVDLRPSSMDKSYTSSTEFGDFSD